MKAWLARRWRGRLRLATVPIRFYRLELAAELRARCRFTPSCSRYAIEAVERFGLLKGSIAAMVRIARCHPAAAGGHDPVGEFRWGPRRPGAGAAAQSGGP